MAGGIFVILLTTVAFGAGLIVRFVVHHPPNTLYTLQGTTVEGLPKGPNGHFWFGFDSVGRDLFVRVIYGARTSLLIAFVATGLSVFIGVVLGLIAGFRGGFADTLVSRSMDVVLSIPILMLAMGIAATCSATVQGCLGGHLKPGLFLIVIIIAFANWPYIARIVRGQTLSLKHREFVEAARSLGESGTRIMFREVLPNIAGTDNRLYDTHHPEQHPLRSDLVLPGGGCQPHNAIVGSDVLGGLDQRCLQVAPWYMFFPGLFLLLTTLAFNLLGDGLQDALSPKRP